MAGKLQSVSNEVEARMLKFDNSVKTKRFRPVARIFQGVQPTDFETEIGKLLMVRETFASAEGAII